MTPDLLVHHIRMYLKSQKKELKVLQYLDLNHQQWQPYGPQMRLNKDLFPPGQLNQEAINEIQKLIEIEKKTYREYLVYITDDI